jgi:hypothetical protein
MNAFGTSRALYLAVALAVAAETAPAEAQMRVSDLAVGARVRVHARAPG